MKRSLLLNAIVILLSFPAFAQEVDSAEFYLQEIENSLHYQTGTIELPSGNAILNVPAGFKYLDQEQTFYVLTDLWGNPEDNSILGMLLPEEKGVIDADDWAFVLSFDEIGYVEDDDANDIDYDELLEQLQEEAQTDNKQRIELGYEPVEIIGWASKPFYDSERNVLHWAKELHFGEEDNHTLNYNLRVLGRKGVFVLNAVASMQELPDVQASINDVLTSVSFKEGHTYADFVPDVDNVAAWTLGGLVAGKVLAKTGFFVLLAKFWKIILIAIIGFFAAIRKKLFKKKETPETTVTEIPQQ